MGLCEEQISDGIMRRALGAEGAADFEVEASAPPVRGAEDPAMDTPSALPGKLRHKNERFWLQAFFKLQAAMYLQDGRLEHSSSTDDLKKDGR